MQSFETNRYECTFKEIEVGSCFYLKGHIDHGLLMRTEDITECTLDGEDCEVIYNAVWTADGAMTYFHADVAVINIKAHIVIE